MQINSRGGRQLKISEKPKELKELLDEGLSKQRLRGCKLRIAAR